VEDHQVALRLYEAQATNGIDPQLRDYAASMLPRIESHLARAKTMLPAAEQAAGDGAGRRRVLRVCADPNNLPFSNARLEGFENRIAELIARDLDARVEYTWWAQRRGFIRNTLRAGTCDVVLGIPTSFELAQATRPYYRSTYVFVWRTDRRYRIESFDDPVLRQLKIGVHLVGDDGSNTPPAHALAQRGIVENVRGYTLYGDYRQESPPSQLIEAVAKGEVDVAIAWGPLAGYYAPKQKVPLTIVPVAPQIDVPFLPFVFDIALGVRRGDDDFRNQLDAILRNRENEIAQILNGYGVPRL
jgi:quinoprotein dehydrogenase-associated probable ABC transporter substrate-binding protein